MARRALAPALGAVVISGWVLLLIILLLVLALGGGGWGYRSGRYGYWSWSPLGVEPRGIVVMPRPLRGAV
jgi:hypothetical protein